MPEKLSDRAVQRIANAVAAGIRETVAEPIPTKKLAKKKSVAQRRTERRTAQSKKAPKGAREKIGRALESAMATEPGRKVARAVGGYGGKKKKKQTRGAGFGGAMPIPGRGGEVSREHGTGLTRTEQSMPLYHRSERFEPIPKKRKKRKKRGKVKV